MSGDRRLWFLLFLILAGCGESPPSPSVDAAGLDASEDGGAVDAGDGASGDAGPDGGVAHAFTDCAPYTVSDCPDGNKCQVVRDPFPGGFDLYFGCVPSATGLVEARLPCSNAVPLAVPVGTDAVTHSCVQNAVCVEDGLATCRPLCGVLGFSCERSAELCVLVNQRPVAAACLRTDGCNPVMQQGCASAACYARQNGFGDWLGDCAVSRAPEGAGAPLSEGQPCTFFDTCEAGTGCHPAVTAAGTFQGSAQCRKYCSTSASCGATVCRTLPLEPGGMFQTPTAIGVCTPP